MTVGQLIEALKAFDANLPVYGTWEGIACKAKDVELGRNDNGKTAVVIDVDNTDWD